eukprot:Gb_35998 [translate_table: standard]
MREHDMSIGAVLQSLEIEDAFGGQGCPPCQFLARSFIENSSQAHGHRKPSLGGETAKEFQKALENKQLDGNECSFDTSEDPVDSPEEFQIEGSIKPTKTVSDYFDAESSHVNDELSKEALSFMRVPGLLPDLEEKHSSHVLEHMGKLDSFVKAQIMLFNEDSPAYANVDKQVLLSLATLSFFCNRPTILAILDFVNAINLEDVEENASDTDAFTTIIKREPAGKDMKEESNVMFDQKDSIVKGLLGRGKDRIIFSLVLSMDRAQIVLNNENGTQLATLSQNNLLTDIKVFPSSFGIKASLGNLKISDNSLHDAHPYFWMCDMRNAGGSSFVELEFFSFNPEDEDYEGFEYSLVGELSEVRFVYLNRFIQELIGYFMGLTPKESNSVVKLKDRMTNSEKCFTESEIEGLPALKLDLSLNKPIIVMPRRTDSNDYLELDVLRVTVQNTFQWLGGCKNEVGAIHMEIVSLQVQDINLAVGLRGKCGERMIQDVNGLSLVIRRSLRDLWHQVPNMEASIKVEKLKAAISDEEYQMITECAVSNIAEIPNIPPPLDTRVESLSYNEKEHEVSEVPPIDRGQSSGEAWTTIKVAVYIDLVELRLHTGRSRDTPLATMQVSGTSVLFKSTSNEESFIMATLKSFSVTDDREGTAQEFRHAIGKADNIDNAPFDWAHADRQETDGQQSRSILKGSDCRPVITMLIMDVKLCQASQKVSICIQRPQLLVALDFLLAVAEFFVPSIQGIISDGTGGNPVDISAGIILDQPIYSQCSEEVTISPTTPLVADNEKYDHFIYDGKGGCLRLVNRIGADLTEPSQEALVLVGSGKKLQFKNVFIQNGEHLDSCVSLGANSSYSASEDDGVFLESERKHSGEGSLQEGSSQDHSPGGREQDTSSPMEIVMELQAIGPEFTFYNTSKGNGVLSILSEKLLHAELDIFSRLVLKGGNIELNANTLGLTVEASSGVRVVEPFDTFVKFSKVSGKTNIHITISDVFTNFSYSILQLFIRLEEDILSFLRMTSKKVTVVCSQFDKIWADQRDSPNQKYAFWRPQAPSGFAVLGDCLTPLDEPPSKGVLALNTSFAKVKRPVSFELIWSSLEYHSESQDFEGHGHLEQRECTVWMPVPPQGYVALGCVVSAGRDQPSLSSAVCVSTTSVTPCPLKDCIFFTYPQQDNGNTKHAFWRIDNSVGSFLPRQPEAEHSNWKAYDLRHVIFGYNECYSQPSTRKPVHDSNTDTNGEVMHLERSASIPSDRRYESVACFELVWWNRGSGLRKKFSIWRPIVPSGCVYLGDIAVQGYEPPNAGSVLRELSDGPLLRFPLDFQKVGQINKQRGMESISFWLPQAPPGYVSLGCIASKNPPKMEDFNLLRCIRNDLVTGDQFPDNSIWDTTEIKHTGEGFSIWTLDNEVGIFIVRSGLQKPPKRFALSLADPSISNEPDDLVIDAEVQRFSAILFDDFGGLMIPLLNFSLSGIAFSLHGRSDNLNSTANLSLMTRSYNEKYDSWEPLIEPVDGFIRYQYDKNSSSAPSQVRVASTRNLNMNVSIANVNMLLEAVASWNKLNEIQGCSRNKDQSSSVSGRRDVLDIDHKTTYYVIPQNKLGRDIFLRTDEFDGKPDVFALPSGDMTDVKVPASKSILDPHSKGNLRRSLAKLVTIVIGDAELPRDDGIGGRQYMVAVRIIPQLLTSGDVQPQQQSARTCFASPVQDLSPKCVRVRWDEAFYFKVDSVETQIMEIIVTDLAKGTPVGFYSTSLTEAILLDCKKSRVPPPNDELDLAWRQLLPEEGRKEEAKCKECQSKIRCAMFISSRLDDENAKSLSTGVKSGVIQIGPTREGPWTTVRLNYASSAACWRMGQDLIASEVSVKDGNKCVVIRSLVSVLNCTDFAIELRLCSESSSQQLESMDNSYREYERQTSDDNYTWDEIFENEKYHSVLGWGSSFPGHFVQSDPGHWSKRDGTYSSQDFPDIQLPTGWEWASDWHIDNNNSSSPEGWTYAFDFGQLKWPPQFDPEGPLTFARRRRWVRERRCISKEGIHAIFVGTLRPGDITPLPVTCLSCSGFRYILQLKTHSLNYVDKHCWSHVLNYSTHTPNIYVSSLVETEELIYCPVKEASTSHSNGLWFCLSVSATEIGKDIHLDPIKDWKVVCTAPLTLVSFLPVSSEFSVLEMGSGGELTVRYRGVIKSGQTSKVYHADLRKPLYLSLIPQGGWQPIHETVLISHPTRELAQYLALKSSYSGRKVRVILEHNQDGKEIIAKFLRIYTPYWLECARCPPLQYRLSSIKQMGRSISKERREGHCSPVLITNSGNEKVLEQINEGELQTGYTIMSKFDPKSMGLSVALSGSDKGCFGPATTLSPLSDADGSVDLKARDGNGNSIRLFVSTKPCPYQSAPTKVICIRPYMTFTNRIGQVLYVKMNSRDQPKILHPSDWRIAYCISDTEEPEKLQVRLEDTKWSYPVAIEKEDTISVVLRQEDGRRQYLRAEIRGYEEDSRFLIVFCLGSTNGPFRIENRTISKRIKHRQSGLDDEAWQLIKPLSTVNFAWEDPYGQHLLDVIVKHADISCVLKFNIDKVGDYNPQEGIGATSLWIRVIQIGDIKVVKFFDKERNPEEKLSDVRKTPAAKGEETVLDTKMKEQRNTDPLEFVLELGVVGVSIVDQRPMEILYLYLERVFVSYSTGYGGNTSRLKLLLGYLQLDNQLPLTHMPVLLAPELPLDLQYPVFKMTFTMSNDTVEGTQVYPYVGIQVVQTYWRVNVHEPIIWAVMDFYKKLHLNRVSGNSDIAQVDPEIRVDFIDISGMRLKFSLETAPAQRPHGVLGMWSPLITTVGNVFKMQIHFRNVVHRNRFMRKSLILPAIFNQIWRDLIHNPLHLLLGVDVLGMTSSTLATLSKGFAELSTDGQFLQLRTKQDWSRRITGVGDGFLQGTEALAQGVAFGVSGMLTKPLASAREHGIIGFVNGLGRAFLGFIVQPVSGVLDFVSLTMNGIGASCTRCFEIFENRSISQRNRIPRAIRGDGLLQDYDERAAFGQMVLHLAETSRHFGCTDMFKETSKFAWSDFYEEHFDIPHHRILLITNRRVLMVQCPSSNKMLTKPCKILWDVSWGELLALELAKGGHQKPSHVILHLRNFRKSECFVRIIKSFVEDEQEGEIQAMRIYSTIQKLWKTYQSKENHSDFQTLSSRQHITSSSHMKLERSFGADSQYQGDNLSESSSQRSPLQFGSKFNLGDKFRIHTFNFHNIWTSEQDSRIRCILCPKVASQDKQICSIWRPVCPEGFISIGDIAHIGKHPPTVTAVYQYSMRAFASPTGFDLAWRNCNDDFITPVSIWVPRAPEGYTSIGYVAVSGYEEPESSSIFCVHSNLVEETMLEDDALWSAPENYPWACNLYQVHSEALQFVALRQQKEVSDCKPWKVFEDKDH